MDKNCQDRKYYDQEVIIFQYIGRIQRLLFCFILLFLSACVTVNSSESIDDRLINTFEDKPVPNGKINYSGFCKPRGDTGVICRFNKEEECNVQINKKVHRVTKTTRSTDSVFKPWVLTVFGIVLVGGGGAFLVNGLTEGPCTDKSPCSTDPKTSIALGISGAALSLPFFITALVDAIRLRNSVEDMGEVVVSDSTKTISCSKAPADNVEVSMVIPDRQLSKTIGKTDSTGLMEFDLASLLETVPENINNIKARIVSSEVCEIPLEPYLAWKKTKRLEAENIEIANIIKVGDSKQCLEWIDHHQEVLTSEKATHQGVDGLIDCALVQLVDLAKASINVNNIDEAQSIIAKADGYGKTSEEIEKLKKKINDIHSKKATAFYKQAQGYFVKGDYRDAKVAVSYCLSELNDHSGCKNVEAAINAAMEREENARKRTEKKQSDLELFSLATDFIFSNQLLQSMKDTLELMDAAERYKQAELIRKYATETFSPLAKKFLHKCDDYRRIYGDEAFRSFINEYGVQAAFTR